MNDPLPAAEQSTELVAGGVKFADPTRAPSSIERYEITGTVADGRGGMGVVYKANDTQLHRVVALKLMMGGATSSALERKRFLVEAEACAHLTHPNVMPVYDFGESEEGPWFVMPLIEGGSLAKRLKDGPLPPQAAVALMIPVCEAVAHAHAQGILHRDLKPANIMLTSAGVPMVADLGLAKRLGDYTQLTATGTVMGTPSYMPPEQALGLPVNELADVFSLGAILYALVTGRPPAQAETPVETLRQVIEELPPRPSTLSPGVDGPLNLIILTCLEKAAEHRYSSAQALAEDLRRWQRQESIAAKRTSTLRSLWKWAKRKPAKAAAAAIAVVGSLAFVVSLLVNQVRLKHERDLTDTVRQNAESLVSTAMTDYRTTVESTVGKLDGLEQITTSVGHYFDQLPPSLVDERVLALQTKLLTLRGEVFTSQGKLTEAQAVLDRALQLAAARQGTPAQALLHAAALVARTNVALRQDDARAADFAASAVTESLAAQEADRASSEATRQLGLARFFQARCQSKSGAWQLAIGSLEQSVACAELVLKADPAHFQKRREQIWAHVELGKMIKNAAFGLKQDLRSRKPAEAETAALQSQLSRAADLYNKAAALLEPMLAEQPWNQPLHRDQCVIHDGLGDLALTGHDDPAGAIIHFKNYLAAATTLANHDARNTEWLREQAVAERALADALGKGKQEAEAEAHRDAGFKLREQLIAIDPTDAKLRREWLNALIERCEARMAQKRWPEALLDAETAHASAGEQARGSEPAWWNNKSVGILTRRGLILAALHPGDPSPALASFQSALKAAAALTDSKLLDAGAERFAAMARRSIERLQSRENESVPDAK
jgi:Protein kinase domain